MTRYRICHDQPNYDIVCSWSVHRCSVCGRVYRCHIPDFPMVGGLWVREYWQQTFWSALLRGKP